MADKKILYIDMDNVLVDFQSGIDELNEEQKNKYDGRFDEVPGIFSLMLPIKDSVKSFEKLSLKYETYVLSTSPWENDTAASDKVRWVKKHLGQAAHKRLILSHNKHLNKGDYIIDDRTKNGVDKFEGEHIHFGQEKFPDWEAVCEYLL
jgi:5'-nucleotidase